MHCCYCIISDLWHIGDSTINALMGALYRIHHYRVSSTVSYYWVYGLIIICYVDIRIRGIDFSVREVIFRVISLILRMEDQFGNFERNSSKSNDISFFHFNLPSRHKLGNKPEVIINNVVLILFLVAGLIQIVFTVMIYYVD